MERELVVEAFRNLGSADQKIREDSNRLLLQVLQSPSIWGTAKIMVTANNHEERFLGAQLLYTKAQEAVWLLNVAQLAELAQFCFTSLAKELESETPNKQVMYGLQKSAALCCLAMVCSGGSFVAGLVDFMKQSQMRFWAGGTILGQLPEQSKKIGNNNLQMTARQRLLGLSSGICEIFLELIRQARQKPNKIQQVLQALESWVEIGLPLLDNHQLFQQFTQGYLNNKQSFTKCSDILVQQFKNIFKRTGKPKEQMMQPSNRVQSKPTLSERQLESLKILSSILLQKFNYIVSQKDLQPHLAQTLYEMLISCHHHLLNVPGINVKLLDCMLTLLKSSNFETSHYAAIFWVSLYSTTSIPEIFRHYYPIVYVIARQRCSIANRPADDIEKISIQVELMDIVQSGNNGAMLFRQYRQYFVELLQTIYKCFGRECGKDQGNKAYFQPIIQMIKVQQNQQYCIQIELALFLTKAVIGLTQHDGNPFISHIISMIPTLPTTNLDVHKSALMFIVNCSRMIANGPLLQPISNYTLNCLFHKDLSNYAAYSFINLVQSIRSHDLRDLTYKLLQLYDNPILQTISEQSLQKFINGHVTLLLCFEKQADIHHHLRVVLDCIVNQTEDIVNEHHSQVKSVKALQRLTLLTDSIDQMFSKDLYYVVSPYLLKIIELIEKTFNLFSHLNFSQTNPLGLFCRTVKCCARLMGDRCITHSLISILNKTMAVFSRNPNENCQLLLVLSCILECLMNQNNLMNAWLNENFRTFVIFIINTVTGNTQGQKNSEMLRYFYKVQQKIIVYRSSLLMQLPEKAAIIDLSLLALHQIHQSHLSKQLLQFLQVYIDIIEPGPDLQSLIPRVICTCLIVLPHLNNVTFNCIGKIMRIYHKVIKPNRFLQFLTMCQWMTNCNPDDLTIVARAMRITMKSNNSKNIKSLLCNLSQFSKGTTSRQQLMSHMKDINESWSQKQSLSD